MNESLTLIPHKEIHKSIRNIVFNEMKLSKEILLEESMRRLESIIGNKIKEKLDSKCFEGLIQRTIMQLMKEGVPNSFYNHDPFYKVILMEVNSQVSKMMHERYEIKIIEKQ